MSALRFLTAGESHGPSLTAIVDGCPARLPLSVRHIDHDLARRQTGYGRGPRMQIESDTATLVGGVRYGLTTGAPIAISIANRDAENWGDTLSPEPVREPAEQVRVPRPGHADLGGALLYGSPDLRDVIERASARETAARVACGAVARQILKAVECTVVSHVCRIGDVAALPADPSTLDPQALDAEPLRCADAQASVAMQAAVDDARERGDTLGGVFEVVALGFPAGVGSYVQGDRRLGARLATALMSIPAIKGVELGLGFAAASLPGSQVHDEIAWDHERGYYRLSSRSGGVEGGISTGDHIVLRAAMKPIATLRTPLQSVELGTHRPVQARFERSDVCAVPAAAVTGEAAVCLALADALLERFGGATVEALVATVHAAADRSHHV